jgi:enediyne biosynthesis protein E4
MPMLRAVIVVVLVALAALAPIQRPRYVDVSSRSNFSYRSNNDYQGRKYFQQPMCGGVGILDYDGDGLMDIFFSNGAKLPALEKTDPSFYNCLLRNKGDGTFDDVTAKAGVLGKDLGYSYGVAIGDYDNDGRSDIFIANTGRNTLYHNNGDGTFGDVTATSGLGVKPADTLSVQAAWFDYDNDGLLDLMLSNYTIWSPEKDRRCQRGDVDVYCSPRTYASVPQRLYHNLGGGKFEDVTEKAGFGSTAGKGMGIAIADFNNDGWMDVFLANDTVPNFLFLNQGNGTFKESALKNGVAYNDNGAPVSAMGADAKDYDNDGDVDIFYNDLMGQIWALFDNAGGKYFRYVSPSTKLAQLSSRYSGWSGGFLDYNNDGWKDIFSANGDVDNLVPDAPQHDTMFENRDGKEFVSVTEEMGPDFLRVGFQRGAAFADLNNDGFPDIVVTSLNQKPRILLNSADSDSHWLLIQLTGHKSNRDAIGARVKLTTPSGRTLYNHVTPSVGFLSSSDRRVHFGLASERSAASIEVRWPGGAVQTLRNVPGNQILKVAEPQ